jgi:hypothetical protein
MRRFIFIAPLLIAAPLQAGLGWGFQLGLAGSRFESAPHPAQPTSASTNLFSILAGQTTLTQEAGLSGGLGLNAHADWARILEAQLELGWAERNAKTIEDPGSGIKRATLYSRDVVESALMLRLGWPFGLKGLAWRPYLSGGAFGNRTLAAKRSIALQGDPGTKDVAWDGLPNEDWGWIYGGGFDFQVPGQAPRIGLEFRCLSGQKDLDPQGANEVKDRTYLGVLSFGF